MDEGRITAPDILWRPLLRLHHGDPQGTTEGVIDDADGIQAGNTFMIPTGWIHAVYTPDDSLVFGGNFLHALNMDGQIEIANLEIRLKVQLRCWYEARFMCCRSR